MSEKLRQDRLLWLQDKVCLYGTLWKNKLTDLIRFSDEFMVSVYVYIKWECVVLWLESVIHLLILLRTVFSGTNWTRMRQKTGFPLSDVRDVSPLLCSSKGFTSVKASQVLSFKKKIFHIYSYEPCYPYKTMALKPWKLFCQLNYLNRKEKSV